jgi:EpsD family peptidyl-prolyl cis-trans isomerase
MGGQLRLKILVALAIVVLAPSCAKKAEGQTVAVVNGEEITVPELNAALARADVPSGADKKQIRQQVLQGLIDRKLVEQQARNQGIDKSPDFLQRERQMEQDLLINMLAQRLSGTSQLPSEQEVEQFEASHPQMFAKRETWTLNQIRFPMPSAAPVVEQINKTKSLQDLENVLRANNVEFTPATTRIDSAVVPQEIYAKIASLAPGEPFVVPVDKNAVASVIVSRDPEPLVGDQAKAAAVAAIRKQQTAELLRSKIKTLRQSAKIQYQPGFAPTGQ